MNAAPSPSQFPDVPATLRTVEKFTHEGALKGSGRALTRFLKVVVTQSAPQAQKGETYEKLMNSLTGTLGNPLTFSNALDRVRGTGFDPEGLVSELMQDLEKISNAYTAFTKDPLDSTEETNFHTAWEQLLTHLNQFYQNHKNQLEPKNPQYNQITMTLAAVAQWLQTIDTALTSFEHNTPSLSSEARGAVFAWKNAQNRPTDFTKLYGGAPIQ